MSLGLGVVDLAPVTTGFLDVMEQVLVVDGLLCRELVVACLFVRHVLPPQITCVDKRPLLEAWYLSIKRKPLAGPSGRPTKGYSFIFEYFYSSQQAKWYPKLLSPEFLYNMFALPPFNNKYASNGVKVFPQHMQSKCLMFSYTKYSLAYRGKVSSCTNSTIRFS